MAETPSGDKPDAIAKTAKPSDIAASAMSGGQPSDTAETAKSGGRMRALRGYLYVALTAFGWASGGLMAKWIFSARDASTAGWVIQPLGLSVDPTVLAADRVLIASLILLVFVAFKRRYILRRTPRELLMLLVFGICSLAMVHFTYFKTISLTTASTAILLEYLAPIFVMLFGVIFMHEKPSWRLPVGICMALLGCALVVGAFTGLVISPEGLAWGLLSAAFFSSYSIMGGLWKNRFTPGTLIFWGIIFAMLFWFAVLGPQKVVEPLLDWRYLLCVAFIACFSTIIPFFLFIKALHYIKPANASTTAMLEPLIVAIVETLLFDTTFTISQIIGGVLILAAIFIIQRSDETVS